MKCKGCNILKRNDCCVIEHERTVENVIEKCPCNECLVKPMCSNRCSERAEYFRDVVKFSKQMRRRYG